jgi:PAS domain S-box-containing protein
MEKHHSCIITKAIIEYFQEHFPGQITGLLVGLGPEIEKLADPKEFLMEINNWVSSSLVIRMFANAREISRDNRVAFKIGLESAIRRKFGYVQRILLFAYKNPRRSLKRAQKLNDRFNRNKKIELLKITRSTAVIRLHWFKEVPGSEDFCLFNKGIYSGIPTMWGLPPALLQETKCFFQGDEYCEYHFKWINNFSLKKALLKFFTPWRAVKYTIEELEKDKEILKEKFDEVHRLNLQLNERLDQLLAVQEALRASEAKFRTLIENIPGVAIYGFGPDGIIQYWNKASETLYGYTAAEALGKKLPDLIIPPGLKPKVARTLEAGSKIIQPGELIPPGEYLLLRKDGLLIPVYSVHTMVLSEGSPIIFHADVDLSERKRAEEERLKLDKLESLSILAGGIAHDFNNILTAIAGNINLAMLEKQFAPQSLERLAAAEKGCRQAHALSARLLTFAKGGSPIKKTCSLQEILHDSLTVGLCSPKSRCEFSIPHDLWPVEADPAQINQVISNLIINADQAMPSGGLITIRAQNVNSGGKADLSLTSGKYVEISISDQGIGIPQENLGKIFDPYFTTKQRGSGLGLATTYSIIKSHGGNITVESALGMGTTFHIYLPVLEDRSPVAAEKAPGLLPGQGKILVMDDEEMVRDMLRLMLQKLGYEANCAANGEEALELLKKALEDQKPFIAAILDLTVPRGKGGKETVRQLLSIDPRIKVIVTSGYADDPIMANFSDYGFHGIIVKPFKITELSNTLHKILE